MLSLSDCMAALLKLLFQSFFERHNKIIKFSSLILFRVIQVFAKPFDLYYANKFKMAQWQSTYA